MGTLLVTGGSRGLGADIARRAAERGWDVAINFAGAREHADRVISDIAGLGRRCLAIKADVSDPAQVDSLFNSVERELGPVYALVNSAGILTGVGRIETLDVERTKRMFEINVYGVFLCCRRAVKSMAKRHGGAGGVIVNISSSAARSAAPSNFVDYAAGKAAIDALTIGLAKEQGSEGIRVNAVRPGLVNTGLGAEFQAKQPTILQDAIAATPLGRIAVPRDVSSAVLWLLSDEAEFISGTIIDISGGRTTQ
jgi:NAD(P)-dependent dehydrogenase (short-subunit alcohol dehydrogenase family)